MNVLWHEEGSIPPGFRISANVNEWVKAQGAVTYGWIFFELPDAILRICTAKTNPELGECHTKHVEKTLVLRKYNGFGPRIMLAEPQDVAPQSIDLRSIRHSKMNLLNFLQHRRIDASVNGICEGAVHLVPGLSVFFAHSSL